MSIVGTFDVTYTYTDSNGNQAVPHIVTVNIHDSEIPLLSLNGESEVYIGLGREYIDLGAEFTDNYDENYTIFDNQTVNTSTEGEYIITYTAYDTNGNHAEAITRTVHVIEDFSILIYDIELEETIREELNKQVGPITQDDLESILYLEADDEGIYDLKGIEYLVNLIELDLYQNYIYDLEPLSNLNKLEILNLYENSISDITPLSNLVNLEKLGLEDNSISNLASILSLSKLNRLDLYGNELSDITDLKTMYDSGIFTRKSNIYLDSNSLDLNEGSEAYNVIFYLASKGIYIDIAEEVVKDDYGNDKTTAEQIDEFPIDGVINYKGDRDWFKFTLSQETEVEVIICTQSSMSTYLNLYYENGSNISFITRKEFGGEDYNSKLNITLQPNTTYYLFISTKDNDGAEENVGTYQLLVDEYINDPGSPEVFFDDLNLENVIRSELNKPTGAITEDDCALIGSLNAANKDISNLTSIEHLTILTYLNLSGNNITDLTPLENLTSIRYLMLNNNDLYDIYLLYNLSNLKLLEVVNTNISDISVLQTLYDNGAFNNNLEGLDNEIKLDLNPIDIYVGSDAYNVISYLYNNNVRLDKNYIFNSDDHGNTYKEATNVDIGDSFSGEIEFSGDFDWFKFTLNEETDLIIYTESLYGVDFYLYDENMDLVDNYYEYVILDSMQSGTYYLRVGYVEGEDVSHYDLYIGSITDDHANSYNNATSVEFESITEGCLNYLYDKDIFTFTLQEETEVLIYTTGLSEIYGFVLNQNYSYCTMINYNRAVKLPAGTYFVEVFSGTIGNYQLHIKEKVDTHSDNLQFATPIAVGTSIDGIIHNSSDDDWFKFIIMEESDIKIYTTSSRFTYLYVQDESGNRIYAYYTEDGKDMIVIKKLTPGTYYINISSGIISEYELYVQEVVISDDYGNDIDNAESITFGTTVGEINYNDDEDYFKLILTEETDVRIYTIGIPMYISLTDNQMIHIDPEDSLKITTRLSAGTYYFKLSSSYIGEYELQIEEINLTDDYGNSSEDSTSIVIDLNLVEL